MASRFFQPAIERHAAKKAAEAAAAAAAAAEVPPPVPQHDETTGKMPALRHEEDFIDVEAKRLPGTEMARQPGTELGLPAEKVKSWRSRVWNVLTKERQLVPNNDNDSAAMRKGKNMLRAGGLIGKAIFDTAASVTGVKLAIDLPLWALQTNEVRKNKNEMKALLKGGGALAEKQAQIKGLIDQANMAKKLSPQEVADFQAALAKIAEGEGEAGERDKKYDALVDNYLRAKTSGMQVVRQAVNTAFMATGLQMVRGVATLGLKGVEAFAEAQNASSRKELNGEQESAGAIFKKKFIDGARNTLSLGMSSENKNRTGLQKVADTAKALGTLGTFFGIGSAALGELSHGSVSEHFHTAMDKMSEHGFDQVGTNIAANSMKMWNIYGHPIDALKNAKNGITAAVGRFFGDGASKEAGIAHAAAAAHGAVEQDGVNYQSETSHADLDGQRLPEEASFGHAAVAGAATRGFMEEGPLPSYVEATPAEQMGMSAAAKIAELQAKAHEVVSGAAGKAFDAIHHLNQPPVAAHGIMENSAPPSYVEASPAEQAAMVAAAKIGQAHEKIADVAGQAKDRAAEFLGLKPHDQEFTFDEEVVVAKRPGLHHVVNHPQFHNVREALRPKEPDFLARMDAADAKREAAAAAAQHGGGSPVDNGPMHSDMDDRQAAAAEQHKAEDGLIDSYRESEAHLKATMGGGARPLVGAPHAAEAAPAAPPAHHEAPVAHHGKPSARDIVQKAWKKAGGDRIDDALKAADTPPKRSIFADAEPAHPKPADVAVGGKSALRLKMEAADRAGRELPPELPDAHPPVAHAAEAAPAAPPAHHEAPVAHHGKPSARDIVQKAWKKAGGDRIDDALKAADTPPKRSIFADAEPAHPKPADVAVGGKSALRLKMEAADRAGRELQPADPEEVARGEQHVAEMKRALKTAGASLEAQHAPNPFEAAAQHNEQALSAELSHYGMKLEHGAKGDSFEFQPPKDVMKALSAHRMLNGEHPFVRSDADPEALKKLAYQQVTTLRGRDAGLNLMSQAYQVGVLEHVASQLPTGAERDSVLAMKRVLQAGLDKMIAKSADVIDQAKVKQMIAAVAKDPGSL